MIYEFEVEVQLEGKGRCATQISIDKRDVAFKEAKACAERYAKTFGDAPVRVWDISRVLVDWLNLSK